MNFCKCGCGQEIIVKPRYKWNGGFDYINGHNRRGKFISIKTKEKLRLKKLGKKLSVEIKEKISLGHIGKNRGKKRSQEVIEKLKKSHLTLEYVEKTLGLHSGINNGNWQGGISKLPYCEKWTEELREKIRERDEGICQNCGKIERENKKGKLSVHHVHYDKENCYPDLISLCCSCNSKVNFNRDYWEELFMKMLKYRDLLN